MCDFLRFDEVCEEETRAKFGKQSVPDKLILNFELEESLRYEDLRVAA